MSENIKNSRRISIHFDIPFFYRNIRRWLFLIICTAIISGAVTYVAMDYMMKETYTATATVAVMPKTNAANAMNDNIMNTAINKNLSMWKSNSLRKVIKDSNPDIQVNGYLNASSLRNSGIVRLTSTASTAEDAYYLLSAALRYYHKIDNNFDTSYTSVILTRMNASSISVEKKSPVKYIVVAFGGVIALWIFLILLFSLTSKQIHNESQARKLLEAQVLGVIPTVKKTGKKAILINDSNITADYITRMDRLAISVEQVMHEKNKKVLMVTSLQENEGKSTVSVNLALNLSRRGNRTVLIDLDLRQPAIYKILQKDSEKINSFSECLKYENDVHQYIEKIDDLYDLSIIWQGKPERDSDRVLEKVDLKGTLSVLAKEYDFVIVDTPPIAPVRDVDVISPIVKDVLMVIRQDFNLATHINDAIDELEEFGSECIGVVLNNSSDPAVKKYNKRSASSRRRKQHTTSRNKKRS